MKKLKGRGNVTGIPIRILNIRHEADIGSLVNHGGYYYLDQHYGIRGKGFSEK